MNNQNKNTNSQGFSLVELLISIAVIGILISIIAVSYVGVAKRAAGERLKSDLMAASSTLTKFKTDRGVYPTTIRCDIPDSATNACLEKSSTDVEYIYNVNTATSPDTYGLTAIKSNNSDLSYRTASGSEPIPCPVGYIVVPGSSTYGTNSFCVMKYEAKKLGASGIPISTPADPVWVNISQTDAINASALACSGCHLISEAEWMTIAQNVLGVSSNWSGGVVGTGYIYSGHNDSAPNNAILADADDMNGYANATNTGGNQRRTLTLSNGEIVWDMAGNICEWTSGQTSGANNQPGVANEDYAIRQWTDITHPGNLGINPSPLNTGLNGAGGWNSSNGIGKIASSTIDTSLRGFGRGSWWGAGNFVGVLTLEFEPPEEVDNRAGFRVSR